MKVSVIELDARLYTMTSHLLMPKMGPLEVGTYLQTHGHDVSVYVECMNGVDETDILRSDMIGFSVGVGNATRVYETVARLKEKSRAIFVAGGPHATMVRSITASITWCAPRGRRHASTCCARSRPAATPGRYWASPIVATACRSTTRRARS